MARRSLFWELFLSYLVVILLCVAGVAGYSATLMWKFFHERTQQELLSAAQMIRADIPAVQDLSKVSNLQKIVKARAEEAQARVTVMDVSGKVLADSEHDPVTMENHANRVEIRQALERGVGFETKPSPTLRVDMKYVAVRVVVDGQTVGVVRTARAMEAINLVLRNLYVHIGLAGLVVAAVAAVLAMLVVRRVTRPLEQMVQGARRFADEDFSHKVFVPGTSETAELAESLNRMATELDEKLCTLMRQKTEQEAVLASMVEGVLAVDDLGRIITMNRSAGRMLKADPARAKGRALEEVIRSAGIQRFFADVLSSGEPGEQKINLPDGEDRVLDVRGSVLREAGGTTMGVLIVLNDITHVNRLENMRRDFVANVSHELKTPVTSIKGFIETLREGGIEDRVKANEFLEILGRHADRLDALIDDLLALSRIERESERHEVQLQPAKLRGVLAAAVNDCEGKAGRANVRLSMTCPEDLVLDMNPQLMEQAVVNLLDNAIKYSSAGSEVTLEATRAGDEVRISVRDTGCGISAEHLSRIFERFYRVDKARSRKLGGTGLGLSIVKHIAQAHRGSVRVESTPGKGSTFTIHIPLQ